MNRNQRGFTLIELMIVVAVVAILAAIAYPSYQAQVIKTRRADGQAMLNKVMQTQERYYTLRNTYETDLTKLGYPTAGSVASDEGYYSVSAAACGAGITSCVALTAARQGAQTGDARCLNLTLDSLGRKGTTNTATDWRDCW
ncbi:MAG: type IV pilin protein [Gammaproteobacteria bacterium]